MGVRSPSYQAGFYAPERGGRPAYPQAWRGCVGQHSPLLGPSGVTLHDWSGLKNHGSFTGMSPSTAWVTDSTGLWGLKLGISDGVESVNASMLTSPELTVSYWMRMSAYSTFGAVLRNDSSYFQLFNNTGAYVAGGYVETTNTSWADNTLRCVTFVNDGVNNQRKVYANGVQVGVYPDSAVYPVAKVTGTLIGYTGTNWQPRATFFEVTSSNRAWTDKDVAIYSRRPGMMHELAARKFYSIASSVSATIFRRSLSQRIGSRGVQ